VIVSPQKSSNPLEVAAPVQASASSRRKTKADVYTVLLVIALVAVLLAIVFLWLYNIDYEWKLKNAGMSRPSASSCQLCRAVDVGPCEVASG
jgi:hypothetical protein